MISHSLNCRGLRSGGMLRSLSHILRYSKAIAGCLGASFSNNFNVHLLKVNYVNILFRCYLLWILFFSISLILHSILSYNAYYVVLLPLLSLWAYLLTCHQIMPPVDAWTVSNCLSRKIISLISMSFLFQLEQQHINSINLMLLLRFVN